ncbi:putative glycosidase crf2 [Zancudomyces culisetae]|uniref:Putative glycosidase crf2 n=1 Tax=Zancudomyces culisetae TaxID=1213189 RepID=A0A1R1PIE1_ZANCU|nr:putative glycosidase crf2 [Zancudomyces culisetae]|eukprot:OMH80775.1 putative glycosidase crf2 [Zancudomyces culisetae]
MAGVCEIANSFSPQSCWAAQTCQNRAYTFQDPSSLKNIVNVSGSSDSTPFISTFQPDNASIANGNLVVSMANGGNNKGFGSTVMLNSDIGVGTYTARIKTASVAPGVVSAFALRNNNNGDELDFEWVGKSPNEVQTNYYWNGVLDYTNMVSHDVGANTSADFHDYTFVVGQDSMQFIVDGKVARVLTKQSTFDAATNTYKFPGTKYSLFFSIWDGGNSGQDGTAQWAGTPTPWGPNTVYTMHVNSLSVQCNSQPPTPPTSSVYTTTQVHYVTKCYAK